MGEGDVAPDVPDVHRDLMSAAPLVQRWALPHPLSALKLLPPSSAVSPGPLEVGGGMDGPLKAECPLPLILSTLARCSCLH